MNHNFKRGILAFSSLAVILIAVFILTPHIGNANSQKSSTTKTDNSIALDDVEIKNVVNDADGTDTTTVTTHPAGTNDSPQNTDSGGISGEESGQDLNQK